MDPRNPVAALWRLFDERRFEEVRPLLAGDRVVTEVEITGDHQVVHAASFTLHEGKIAGAREVFAEPGAPPFDRRQWAERY